MKYADIENYRWRPVTYWSYRYSSNLDFSNRCRIFPFLQYLNIMEIEESFGCYFFTPYIFYDPGRSVWIFCNYICHTSSSISVFIFDNDYFSFCQSRSILPYSMNHKCVWHRGFKYHFSSCITLDCRHPSCNSKTSI